MDMTMGTLDVVPAMSRTDLLATPVARALEALAGEWGTGSVGVAEIDPAVADTAAFCERYGVAAGDSANCVVITGRRGGEARYAACVVLASTRAAVNGPARRRLDVRKASFAPVDDAVGRTGMAYGGITPIGLPPSWPVLLDARVAAAPRVVIGSGTRGSKLTLPGSLLARLPGAEIIGDLAR